MTDGKRIRLSKIIDQSDQRAIVVAADHGMMLGPISGAAKLESTLKEVIKGRPDAILVSPGQARILSHLFMGKESPALLIRADWTNAFRDRTYTLPARSTQFCPVAEVKRAVSLGADAITIYLFVGYQDAEQESLHFRQAVDFSRQSSEFGIPLIIEPIPMGPKVTKTNYEELVRESVERAVEVGADALKVPYTGDPETFSSVVNAAKGVPLLILGGYRALSPREPLEAVEEALSVGASGVVFGRNVIQSGEPAQVLELIRRVVHEGKSAREALAGSITGPIMLKTNPDLCTYCRLCVSACAMVHERESDPEKSRLKVHMAWPGAVELATCTQCGLCVPACPTGALSLDQKRGGLRYARELCNLCGECKKACPYDLPVIKDDKVFVCDMCNGWPECVDWCPAKAIEVTTR